MKILLLSVASLLNSITLCGLMLLIRSFRREVAWVHSHLYWLKFAEPTPTETETHDSARDVVVLASPVTDLPAAALRREARAAARR